MSSIPVELLTLSPLALAAGVDLYLTLLFIGAAPTMGLWDSPMPGALSDLDSPGVLIMVGAFYVLEFAAERFPPVALAWNAFHAIIRPVSGMLLGLLILDGQPLGVIVAGSLLGAALASLAHGIRAGGAVMRWLGPVSTPSVLLVSLAEDVLVLGLVSLTLDAPAWALAASLALLAAFGPSTPSRLRAFLFAIDLAIGRAFQTLRQRRWRGADDLPSWVSNAVEDDLAAPGGALRGCPAGALRIRGAPAFAIGWVVVRGGALLFVHRRRKRVVQIDLASLAATSVTEGGFYRAVDLAGEASHGRVMFRLTGPSAESLRAEFLVVGSG